MIGMLPQVEAINPLPKLTKDDPGGWAVRLTTGWIGFVHAKEVK